MAEQQKFSLSARWHRPPLPEPPTCCTEPVHSPRLCLSVCRFGSDISDIIAQGFDRRDLARRAPTVPRAKEDAVYRVRRRMRSQSYL